MIVCYRLNPSGKETCLGILGRSGNITYFLRFFKGVEKAYAVQAGRELRVMVKPEEIDDLTAHQIARQIKEKIESELKYPGTIKVTVIRETRAQEEAK